ncbi:MULTISPECIES: GMC family oxidoreductase [unclassified Serratia (in: enterobacteria)]|uniref:GMC family oxidoreductase n=1 Tax=unclassified Serratia (in: enterobacteria) TaxID=2647522 RepID=UPI0030763D67
MQQISWQQATARHYDAVIVGSGFAGCIMAKQLVKAGRRVLIVEAGTGETRFSQNLEHVQTFMVASAKTPNSPYPNSPNAPQPEVTDVEPITPGHLSHKGYFVQAGPYPFESNYTRRLGGTSLHWFGSCPRMLPQDFAMATLFGRGVDWPLTYDDLLPYYALAEWEIGVSADVQEQQYHDIHFGPDYRYPMHKIPQSYLDQWMIAGLANAPLPGTDRAAQIRSIPQGRNSVPNDGYTPRGAVGNPAVGQRCMGNSSCIPICPIQARYNALKTLVETDADLLIQTVASRLHIAPENGHIRALDCKVWLNDSSNAHVDITLHGDLFILGANAIENAVLLLASRACQSSGELGRNLMDHPAILSWGLSPQAIGAFRGPGLTSTLVNYRGGEFRRDRAAFVLEIGNWGWSWPRNEPVDSTRDLVDGEKLYGTALRQRLGQDLPRQIRLDMMTEQLPNAANRVTIDDRCRDPLGNYRPVLHYNVDDYTQRGMVFARDVARDLFRQLHIEDFTQYPASNPGYFTWQGRGYVWAGVGHIAGTHRMGTRPDNSVVNRHQQSWDHANLYVIGCGSMPTLGTSNPTLTMTALTLATADHILGRKH